MFIFMDLTVSALWTWRRGSLCLPVMQAIIIEQLVSEGMVSNSNENAS